MISRILRTHAQHRCWSFIALLFLAGSAAAQWGMPIVEILSDGMTGVQKNVGPNSITVNQAGFLHVVWSESRPGPAGGNWIITNDNHYGGSWGQPDTVNTPEQIAYNPIIAVSPITYATYIAFEADDNLVLAYQGTVGWIYRTIATAPMFQCCPTIDIDDSGVIHLAWVGEADFVEEFHIGYAAITEDSVYAQLLTHTGPGIFGLGAAPSIAATSNGVAHITYRNGEYEDYHVVHTFNDTLAGASWTELPLFTSNQEDLTSQIVADDLDLHAVVCGDEGWGMPAHIYYFYKPARGVWSQPVLVSGTYNAVGGTIAVDPISGPHILSMERSGSILTGNILASMVMPDWEWATSLLIGDDYFDPYLVVSPSAYGHVLCSTGGNTGTYTIRHLRSQGPLSLLPSIVVAPDTLRFGEVRVGFDSTRILAIYNQGQAPLVVDTIECTPGFSTGFNTFPVIIDPEQVLHIPVTFSPLETGNYEGGCAISHNAPGRNTMVPLYGSGAVNLQPTPFSRVIPADSSVDPWWTEIPYVLLAWTPSSDPEGVPISYHIYACTPANPHFFEFNTSTPDTSYLLEIPIPVLDEPTEFNWTVHATDGTNQVSALNGTGVFYCNIDAADDPLILNPSSYSLTAFPNPFNPAATMTFNLPKSGIAALRVYDITGRMVQELTAGYLTAGQHALHFDGSNLPTGVYVARLEAANVRQTCKLLLLK